MVRKGEPVTKLTKAVKRTADMARLELVVTLYPSNVIGLRQKRCRREYTLPLLTVFKLAIEADQARVKAEKRKARGQRVLVRRGLL